jgi:hypothetical protein
MADKNKLLYRHEVDSKIDYVVMESYQLSILHKDNKILVALYEFMHGSEQETVHEMPVADAIEMAKAIIAALGDGS